MSGFVFLAALFFIALFGNFLHLAAPYVMPLPVLFLAASMLCHYRKVGLISAVLFLSSLGDMAGSADCFLAQISFFSAAHICYTAYFLRDARFSKASLPLLSIVLSAVLTISCNIVPHTDGIERWFVILYILIITTMAAMRLPALCSCRVGLHGIRFDYSMEPVRRNNTARGGIYHVQLLCRPASVCRNDNQDMFGIVNLSVFLQFPVSICR